MGPLGVLAVGIGGAVLGAGVHQVGIDQGAQWVRQNEFPQVRDYYYALGRRDQHREDAQEFQAFRAEIAEMKSLIQQLQSKQLVGEIVDEVKKALPPGAWGDLWSSNGHAPEN